MVDINWDLVQALFVIVAIMGVMFLVGNSIRKDD